MPKQLLKDVKIIKKNGKWEKGKWIEEKDKTKIIKGIYMPVSSNTLKKYPAGAITLEDISLITKEKISLQAKVLIEGKKYEIFQVSDYGYLSDVKFYILRKSDKDD